MNASTLSGGPPDQSMTSSLRGAHLLGWASFGLAAAFLIAPKRITRTFGLEGKEHLVRAFGAQEIMAGVGALSVSPTPAMWSRVGGDLIHMGTLATGLREGDGTQKRNIALGLGLIAGFLAVDALVATKLGSERGRSRGEHRDYSDRSGFPKGAAQARGVASDFETPRDYRQQPGQAADIRVPQNIAAKEPETTR